LIILHLLSFHFVNSRTDIRRNIELGRIGATDAEIEAAARQANAHDFILTKAQGYQSLIGERGVTLSGGERQRLAIARALLKTRRS
jgi:ABC-type multidrug transport system fused ATPase/permease subunit